MAPGDVDEPLPAVQQEGLRLPQAVQHRCGDFDLAGKEFLGESAAKSAPALAEERFRQLRHHVPRAGMDQEVLFFDAKADLVHRLARRPLFLKRRRTTAAGSGFVPPAGPHRIL
ncbi:hypothetical protein D3C81_1813710 [compost metagenome]